MKGKNKNDKFIKFQYCLAYLDFIRHKKVSKNQGYKIGSKSIFGDMRERNPMKIPQKTMRCETDNRTRY